MLGWLVFPPLIPRTAFGSATFDLTTTLHISILMDPTQAIAWHDDNIEDHESNVEEIPQVRTVSIL